MKHVLVITDFSQNAQNALNYGCLLFEGVPTFFHLLNACPIHQFTKNEEALDKWTQKSISNLEKLLNEIKGNNKNTRHSFGAISKPLPITVATTNVVSKENIDIILLPTKGPKGAKETFLGTDAVSIINTIKSVPIIVVPKVFTVKKPVQIIFSTNFKRVFNRKELETLTVVAKSLNCKIKIIQIMNDNNLDEFQKLNKEYLADIFSGLEHSFEKIQVKTSETAAINDYVKKMEGDMISLVNHNYNFLQKIIQENVVKKVTFNSEVPILVLPELVCQSSIRTNQDHAEQIVL